MAQQTTAILGTVAPNLPTPPTTYTQTYVQDLNNAERLYFTQVDSVNQQLITNTYSQLTCQWLGLF